MNDRRGRAPDYETEAHVTCDRPHCLVLFLGTPQTPTTNQGRVTPDFRVQVWGYIAADFSSRVWSYSELRSQAGERVACSASDG